LYHSSFSLLLAHEDKSYPGALIASLAAKGDGFMLEEEVSKRIDEIVQEGIFRQHKTAIVDYPLAHQPFPFSEVAALKSEKHGDVYLILEFADHIYTAAQVQAKYGTPYDTNISQRYSVFTYRVDSTRYTSKAVFEIDPVDGAVIKVAISLKPRNHH
jgi:DNA-binding Lrp family transcriptional regulator